MSTETAAEDKLIRLWIESNPHKPGPEDAWVLPRYVPIWALIGQLELDGWRTLAVAGDYKLPREAVEAAIAYYRRHRAAIDERIRRNRASFA